MGFSRKEYWSGWRCPPPGDLPNPGIKPRSPTLQKDSLLSYTRAAYVLGGGKYYVPGTAMEVLRSCDRPAVEYYSAVIYGELLINSTTEMKLKIIKLNKRIYTL